MYLRGWVTSLMVVLLVCTSGCTLPGGGKNNGSGNSLAEFNVPTLPDQYVAQPAVTASPGSGIVTQIPTLGDLPVIEAAAKTTINGTGLAGNSSNSTSTNSTIPVAQFTSDIAMGFAPLTVQFTDTSLNMPTSWSWYFGDGNSSTLQNPSNTYSSGGQYEVILTAANDAGSNTLNATKYVSVYVPGFSVYPSSGSAPLTVTFTDAGIGYPQPSAWYWKFGDIGAGNTSSLRNTTHQYLSPGTYDVSFRIYGSAGTAWVNRSAAVIVT